MNKFERAKRFTVTGNCWGEGDSLSKCSHNSAFKSRLKVQMKSNMAGACLEVNYTTLSVLLMCEQLAEVTTCRHVCTHTHTHTHTDTHTFRDDLWASKEQLKMRHWTMYDRSMGMSLWLLQEAKCSDHNSEWWRVRPEGPRVCVCVCVCVCVLFVYKCELWICRMGFQAHKCVSG